VYLTSAEINYHSCKINSFDPDLTLDLYFKNFFVKINNAKIIEDYFEARKGFP
jgi:hypothetical protein